MRSKYNKNLSPRSSQFLMLSEDAPFAIQEAYKAIRTNIMFSIASDRCKRIVITSSVKGEGKSATAVNLAIAFAQNHSRVLLIDCDLRLPTDAAKLGTASTPGLSNLLVGMRSVNETIRSLPNGLNLLPAGDIPPNPTELLGSDRMKQLLDLLSNHYDYILLDTPPVCTVSDATILAKETDGVVVVSRQGVATQDSIQETLNQLQFANAKLLGFVYTGVKNEKSKHYRNYGYDYGDARKKRH